MHNHQVSYSENYFKISLHYLFSLKQDITHCMDQLNVIHVHHYTKSPNLNYGIFTVLTNKNLTMLHPHLVQYSG